MMSVKSSCRATPSFRLLRTPSLLFNMLLILLLAVTLNTCTTSAAAYIDVKGQGSMLRDNNQWSADCILLCHAECSVWKGYNLKHCTRLCMAAGITNFTQEFCFNMQQGGRGKKRSAFSPLLRSESLSDVDLDQLLG